MKRFVVTLSFAFLFVTFASSSAICQEALSKSDLGGKKTTRDVDYDWKVTLPFNISGYYWTGLHVCSDYLDSRPFLLEFYDADSLYAEEEFESVGGVTDFVGNFLTHPDDFISPSWIVVYSDEPFAVIQFVCQSDYMGFSMQTFYAYPESWGWIHAGDKTPF